MGEVQRQLFILPGADIDFNIDKLAQGATETKGQADAYANLQGQHYEAKCTVALIAVIALVALASALGIKLSSSAGLGASAAVVIPIGGWLYARSQHNQARERWKVTAEEQVDIWNKVKLHFAGKIESRQRALIEIASGNMGRPTVIGKPFSGKDGLEALYEEQEKNHKEDIERAKQISGAGGTCPELNTAWCHLKEVCARYAQGRKYMFNVEFMDSVSNPRVRSVSAIALENVHTTQTAVEF